MRTYTAYGKYWGKRSVPPIWSDMIPFDHVVIVIWCVAELQYTFSSALPSPSRTAAPLGLAVPTTKAEATAIKATTLATRRAKRLRPPRAVPTAVVSLAGAVTQRVEFGLDVHGFFL